MKKILLALFILIGFSVSGQVLQTPTNYGYAFRRVGGDTLLFIPGDTLQVPATYNSKTFVARKGTTLYYWNGTKWTAISGAGGTNIYTDDGTLTGNRTLSGGNFNLSFTGLRQLLFSQSAMSSNGSGNGANNSTISITGALS